MVILGIAYTEWIRDSYTQVVDQNGKLMIGYVCWLIVVLVMVERLELVMQRYSISIRLDEITVVGEDIWRQS